MNERLNEQAHGCVGRYAEQVLPVLPASRETAGVTQDIATDPTLVSRLLGWE